MKRTVIDVKPDPLAGCWVLAFRGPKALSPKPCRTKAHAVAAGRRFAYELEPSQLVIRGKNGRIQTEHTYPRSSDPKRRKG